MDTITATAIKLTPTAGIWSLVLIAVITLIKAWPRLMELSAGSDASLRTDLLDRVATLEAQLEALHLAMDAARESHEREMRILRHQLNNERMSLDLLLAMLENAPEKVTDIVVKVKELRAQHALEIAAERGLALRDDAVQDLGKLATGIDRLNRKSRGRE